MSAVLTMIEAEAAKRGETLEQAVRHHLLAGLIARVGRSTGGAGFVLRGGMATRVWVAPLPRPTTDLDYVGDFEFSVDETVRRFAPALHEKLDDGVHIDDASLAAKGIWLDTDFPGVRFGVCMGLGPADQPITIDVGFRDPLVPEATSMTIDGESVRCVRPETQIAWKLHALAEMKSSFRPKDLADLWRITARVALDEAALPPAIDAAFTSRGYSLNDAKNVLEAPHWGTKSTGVRWTPNRSGTGLPSLSRVLADVRGRLSRALSSLSEGAVPS
jgi:hypothetical protein